MESHTTTVVSQATPTTELTETSDVSGMTGSHYAGIVIGVIAAVVAVLAVVIYSIHRYSKNFFLLNHLIFYVLSVRCQLSVLRMSKL